MPKKQKGRFGRRPLLTTHKRPRCGVCGTRLQQNLNAANELDPHVWRCPHCTHWMGGLAKRNATGLAHPLQDVYRPFPSASLYFRENAIVVALAAIAQVNAIDLLTLPGVTAEDYGQFRQLMGCSLRTFLADSMIPLLLLREAEQAMIDEALPAKDDV